MPSVNYTLPVWGDIFLVLTLFIGIFIDFGKAFNLSVKNELGDKNSLSFVILV